MSQIYLDSSMLNITQEFIQDYLTTLTDPQLQSFKISFTALTVTLSLIFTVLYLRKPADIPHFKVTIPEPATLHWKGKRVPTSIRSSEEPEYIQSYCPATGQFLGKTKSFSKSDIDAAIDAAGEAQRSWKTTTFEQRCQVLATLKQHILDNQEAIARVACRDSGKTMVDASMGEILVTLEKIQWTLQHGEATLRPSKRPGPTNLFMKYKGAEVRYEPLGVIGAIVSWNYPFHNLLGPIITAIFAGNAAVVRVSEQVVWSSMHFVSIVQKCLEVCGHDPQLVQVVACWPQEAGYFTAHPGLKHLTFIGSKEVAHHVVRDASESLTPVVVELGGKDAFIVLDSASDIESLASIILRGTFQSAGQNCIGIERVIVTPKHYDQLVSLLKDRVAGLRLGSDIDSGNVDMGAAITNARFAALEQSVQRAVDQGATLVHGGKQYTHPNYPQGHYFLPTLLIDLDSSMDIAQNEVFGPVLSIFKAKDTQDAIAMANSTIYGLGASVFGSYSEANAVANELATGNVAINDFATYYVCQLPFGGINGSGYGKFGGEEGLRGVCNQKSVCYDRIPGVKTKIPRVLDYPVNEGAWPFVSGFIGGAYGGVLGLAKNLKNILKGL